MPPPRKPKPLPKSLRAIGAIHPGDPHQPHVGNVTALRARLLALVDVDDAALDALGAGTVSTDQAWAMTEAALDALARGLLGQDPAVGHLPGWNAPGALDAHLRRVLNLPDGLPEDAVKTALAKLLAVSRQVRADAGSGTLDAETAGAVLLHYINATAAHLLGEAPPPPGG